METAINFLREKGIKLHYLLLPLFLAALDVISTAMAAVIATFIRFEFVLQSRYLQDVMLQLPIFICLVLCFAMLFKLYNRIWRYAGTSEMLAIIASVALSTICWFGYSLLIGSMLPRSIYVISGMLLLIFIGGSRLALRTYGYLSSKPKFAAMVTKAPLKNVLVIGAGDAGAVITREIERYHNDGRTVVGFIDDDKNKLHQRMFGVKVLGDRFTIKENIVKYDVDEIIIAMPSVQGDDLRQIIEICQRTKCKMKILPGVYEIINGDASVSKLRDVQIEDLLGREPIKLDDTAVSKYIKDKTVLITGAGGSIGSEICRQVARMQPKKMLLLGKGENSIYEINQELQGSFPEIKKVPIIADVRDRERIKGIMDYFKPQVVFHAAAHKHVPLMEYQPIEAVKNNVLGTKVVAEEASAHNVETFVMISTDKAVNPTSVMGCTKRVAEMFVQSMNAVSKPRFVAVRFGNVLGSRGSVIPLFKKQIAKGGPVTVTHPDMKRYFMTIPEASQLVLQAGAMAKGGEVFVLDMGEPVKICDLAKDLITLSGLTPGVDIEIKYTGLRPGEKLFEELLSAEDGTEQTDHEKIFTARIKEVKKAKMDEYVDELLGHTQEDEVVKTLQKVVPTYTPNRIKD